MPNDLTLMTSLMTSPHDELGVGLLRPVALGAVVSPMHRAPNESHGRVSHRRMGYAAGVTAAGACEAGLVDKPAGLVDKPLTPLVEKDCMHASKSHLIDDPLHHRTVIRGHQPTGQEEGGADAVFAHAVSFVGSEHELEIRNIE